MRGQPTPVYLSISERVREKLGKKKNQGNRLFLGKWEKRKNEENWREKMGGKRGPANLGKWREKKNLRKKNDEEWRFGRRGYEW